MAGVGVGQARARTDDGQQGKPWACIRGATSSGGLDGIIGMLRKLSVGVRGLNRTCVTLLTSLTVGGRGEGNSPVTSDTSLLMVDVV